jgi:hypothetical protein
MTDKHTQQPNVALDEKLTKAQTGRGAHGQPAGHAGEKEPEGALESLGRAVSEPVLGAEPPEHTDALGNRALRKGSGD